MTGAVTTDLPTATGARVRAALGELLRPRRGVAVVALVALGGSAAVSLLAAPLLGRIIDLAASRGDPDALPGLAFALVGVALGQGLLAVLGVALVSRVGEGLLADLREGYVARALRLPMARVEGAGSGDLTARVADDVTLVGEAVRGAVPTFARSVLLIALTVVGLAVLDWRFALAALVAAPIQAATARWYLGVSGPLYTEQRVLTARLHQRLLDAVGGARTVRAYRLQAVAAGQVADASLQRVDVVRRVIVLHTRFFGRLNAAEAVGLSAVLVAGFLLVRTGSATIGTASAAALYFVNLFGPVNQALFLLDTVQSATSSLARLVGVLDLPLEPEPDAPARPADGSVRVDGVGHAYGDGPDVLHGVDLNVPATARVALVGASGAGKSTLARIVAGIHPATRGTVRLGGVSLPELGTAGTRAAVTLIDQETHVFAGPLAADLRLVAPDADDTALRAALERVEALEWVDALPDGLATVVGAGGRALTPVQAQQLALARLALADPPVAVLDEASAEAGSAGAAVLERAALRVLEGRTGIVVAHRLTQATTADLVVVLDDGRVVESGTHAELVARGGFYARLWGAWSDQRPPP